MLNGCVKDKEGKLFPDLRLRSEKKQQNIQICQKKMRCGQMVWSVCRDLFDFRFSPV